jgi:hypothetical protein
MDVLLSPCALRKVIEADNAIKVNPKNAQAGNEGTDGYVDSDSGRITVGSELVSAL